MNDIIIEAANRLSGVAHKTPVITSRLLNEYIGGEIYLKCENFQRMGAFKFRGAYNTISKLDREKRERGVIAFSSGNHAQAVALVGQMLNIKTVIVMPHDAPSVKLEATKGYGAEVVIYERGREDREYITERLVNKYGYTLIPPFNHLDIIAGQGTAAKELIDEVGQLDYIIAPCGGGGLLSGTALAAKGMLKECQVIGVEPIGADDATRSFYSGKIFKIDNPQTIADGVRTNSLGDITFSIISKNVNSMLTVTEEDIIDTMHYMWSRLKIVVEPTGALSLAPIYTKKLNGKGKKIGVIISGGNVDIASVCQVLGKYNKK